MNALDHDCCRALIEATFVRGSISRADDTAMREHIRECPSCEQVFERYAGAEGALYGADTPGHPRASPLTAGQLDRVANRLFEAPKVSNASRFAWAPWMTAAVTAASIAVVVALPSAESDRSPSSPTDELRSRQGTEEKIAPEAGLRLLRLQTREGELQVEDLGTKGTVMSGDQIAILASNLGGFDHVTVFRPEEEGRVVLVDAYALEADGLDQRLGVVQVDDDWPSGPVAVTAEFRGPDGRHATRQVVLQVEDRP